jgi:hypothetical protein
MNRFASWTTLSSALALLALTGAARADEETIAVNELPRAVIKAVKAKFPGAVITEAAEEEDDEGETKFEVSLEFKGHAFDVALEPNGKIVEIEKELSPDDLPKAVKRALRARYPNAEIEKAEEVTKSGKPPYYEVVVKAEVAFTAKGKVVEADEEEEEEEHHAKPAAKARKSSKEKEDEDEDDDARSHSKVKKSKKSARAEADEDDDKPASAKARKAKRVEKDDDDDDDDEND